MSISQIIKTRRTVYQFSDKKVSDELVRQALELALWAPNHKMTVPWVFVKVGAKSRTAIADLAVQLKTEKSKNQLSEVTQKAMKRQYLDCPVLIAIGKKSNPDANTALEDYASVAAGLQNTALFLWENGVGSKWTTGAVSRHSQTYEILHVDPDSVNLLGFFCIGYPSQMPQAPARPDIDKVLITVE